MEKPPPLVRSILFSLMIALIITVLYLAGVFEQIENLSYDTALRLQGEQPRDDSLILVTIDESCLKKLGRWPWPRSTMAHLLEIISEGNPASIGIDVGFFETDQEHPGDDKQLIAATEKSGRVIYPIYLADLSSLGEVVTFQKPFAGLAGTAAGLGHVHVEPSLDGVVRKVYLRQVCGGESIPAFALKCIAEYLSRTGEECTVQFADDGIEIGEIFIPTTSQTANNQDETDGLITQDHLLYIRFAGPGATFLSLPAWEILKDDFPRQIFRDKIVLIGTTAAGLGDVSMTPFSTERKPMPGVEIQANIINTILTKNFITRPTGGLVVALIFLLSLVAGWIFYSLGTRGAFLAFLGMLLGMVGLHLFLLFRARLWLDVWPFLSVILVNYLGVTARKFGFLFNSLDEEIKDLNRIQKFAPPLPQTPNEEKFFVTLFTFLSSLFKIDTALLLLFDHGGKKLTVRHAWGDQNPAMVGHSFSPSPVFQDLSESREVHWREKEYYFPENKLQPRTCLILPLKVRDQQLGFLVVGRTLGSSFQKSEISTGKMIASHLSYALQKLAAYSRLIRPVGGSIHFFHPGGMERKIKNLNLLSRAMTYEQILLVSMLDSITDGVIVADLLGNILLVNPRAREILNLPEEETRNLNIIILLNGLLSLTREEFLSRFHHLLAEREAFTREVTISSRTYLLSLTSFRRKDEIPGGIMAVLTEITYLKELDKLRAETMAMLTHEIKNPLSGIMSFCDLFVKGVLKPEETTEYIHLIKESVTGLHKLVSEYLAVSRLESDAEELKLDPVDLEKTAEEAITLLTPHAKKQGIRIEIDRPDRRTEIKGNADMLRRVCGNLIGNAIQYSPSSTKIVVSLSHLGDRVVLEVADRGYGIPEEDRENIFEKFFRSARTRKITGIGLGLAITKEIVKRHGGEIWMKERDGGGSVFTVTFKAMSDP